MDLELHGGVPAPIIILAVEPELQVTLLLADRNQKGILEVYSASPDAA
jgi:hypothetical protein